MKDELKEIIEQIADALRPIVDSIEQGPELTRNYYGDYMVLIGQLKHGRKYPVEFYGLCLLEAGANVHGVEAAVKLLK